MNKSSHVLPVFNLIQRNKVMDKTRSSCDQFIALCCIKFLVDIMNGSKHSKCILQRMKLIIVSQQNAEYLNISCFLDYINIKYTCGFFFIVIHRYENTTFDIKRLFACVSFIDSWFAEIFSLVVSVFSHDPKL